MSETTQTTQIARDCYREAVEHLLAGRPEETLRLLEPEAGESASAETLLALSKGYLALGRGGEASRWLSVLLDRSASRSDAGLHAYLRLLAASAAALEANPGDAISHLNEVARIDPRMEHAAIDLRRRMEKGQPPAIRF